MDLIKDVFLILGSVTLLAGLLAWQPWHKNIADRADVSGPLAFVIMMGLAFAWLVWAAWLLLTWALN